MNYKALIFVDGLFLPIYKVCNALKPIKTSSAKTNHFVVIKLFGIGSITRIAHVTKSINIPNKKITFITLHQNKAIIDLLDLNAVYIKSNNPFAIIGTLLATILNVWRRKNTSILDMERVSNLSGLFRLLIGIGKPCSSFCFETKVNTTSRQNSVSLLNKPATHAIAELFGKTYTYKPNEALLTNKSNKIAVNINAGNYLEERKFPVHKFTSLITSLYDKHPSWHFYLTGANSEFTYVRYFEQELIKKGIPKQQLTILAGQHNLKDFVNHLRQVKLFITNDSGPLHISYFFNVKTIGIWGPTSAKLVGYKDSELMLNLNPDLWCSPCFVHPKSKVAVVCNHNIDCLSKRNTDGMATKISKFAHT